MSEPRRMCIVADGLFDVFTAKTAMGLLRYCPDEVVAVVDRDHAGQKMEDVVGLAVDVPIVDGVDAVRKFNPTQLVIGVALPGGRLPDHYRRIVLESLAAGMDVVNGLHARLNGDAEFVAAAKQARRRLWDVRTPPADLHVGTGKARQTRGRRILTVGTDCNLGKRVTASEIVREMQGRGLNAEFVPTGQTGVMIAGWGVAVDAVVADFVSGAAEQSVLQKKDADFIVVEGQGALVHPGYSAVTLGLMHGVLPDYLVLCHAPARKTMRSSDAPVIEPVDMMALSEGVLRSIHPARFIGVSLNCYGMSDAEAAAERQKTHEQTGLPVVDSIRTGVGPLVDALAAAS